MTSTPYKCTVCKEGEIVRVVENDERPPFRPYEYLVCKACGIHHEVDGGKLGRTDVSGPLVDISAEEALEWQARGGCPRICGRDFPWEVE